MKHCTDLSKKKPSEIAVLVEPVCRGSRLHILANSVGALKHQFHIVIITRPNYKSEHFRKLMSSHRGAYEVVTTNVDLQGSWIRNLSVREWSSYVRELRILQKKRGPLRLLVFMALDDYLVAFLLLSVYLRFVIKAHSLYTIKYRVEYLWNKDSRKNLRHKLLNACTRLALRMSGAKLICFDERLKAVDAPGEAIGHLPDPWFGGFSKELRPEARRRYGFDSDAFIALTVGRQDRRKGLPFLLDSANELLGAIPNLTLWVVGHIDEQYKERFKDVMICHDGRILHWDTFVPEDELPYVFATADVVLLPYSLDFTASSGVLPRAAASGTPVVTPSHGLVGHRVKYWNLGETYAASSVQEFVRSVSRVRAYAPSFKQKSLQAFALSCSVNEFEKALRDVLVGDQL